MSSKKSNSGTMARNKQERKKRNEEGEIKKNKKIKIQRQDVQEGRNVRAMLYRHTTSISPPRVTGFHKRSYNMLKQHGGLKKP